MSEIPGDLRYTAEHEWVQDKGDGVVRVGITAYAAEALGDVVYISLPGVGDTVSGGQSCGEVESTKSVSDLYAPADGEIVAVNDSLEATPESVNTDPYGEGWMYDLSLADPSVVDGMLDAEGYAAILD
ncbi:MAG: glycine cleavage system protein GcvH [Dermatophilaceae bacterium]|nr:glycine cleavage system protein GcvH [Intrasporangiaceae bacterium]